MEQEYDIGHWPSTSTIAKEVWEQRWEPSEIDKVDQVIELWYVERGVTHCIAHSDNATDYDIIRFLDSMQAK